MSKFLPPFILYFVAITVAIRPIIRHPIMRHPIIRRPKLTLIFLSFDYTSTFFTQKFTILFQSLLKLSYYTYLCTCE